MAEIKALKGALALAIMRHDKKEIRMVSSHANRNQCCIKRSVKKL
jgi:hypothetical protein